MAKGVGKNGELFEQLIEPEHLLRCARLAVRGKRRRPDVARFLLELEPHLLRIARGLRDGNWKPGAYRSFEIKEPKPRLISAAPIADRVVHHALVSILEPVFEKRFVAHSYACRKGKGTHRALMRAHDLAQRHRFVLKGDIVKFFPSLDHEVVKAELRRVIADERFLAVMDAVIDGSNDQEAIEPFWFPGDELLDPGSRRLGLPIGNLTSQFLANVVLDRLDHFVMDERGHGAYLRYCDDFLVFGNDRKALWNLREDIFEQLAALRLRLHQRKGGVLGTRGPVPFLGFILHGARRRLPRASIVRAQRRLEALAVEVCAGRVSHERFRVSVQAFAAHAAHGHTMAIRRKMFARLRGVVPHRAETRDGDSPN